MDNPTINTSKDKRLAETEIKDYIFPLHAVHMIPILEGTTEYISMFDQISITISCSSSFFCSSGETF